MQCLYKVLASFLDATNKTTNLVIVDDTQRKANKPRKQIGLLSYHRKAGQAHFPPQTSRLRRHHLLRHPLPPQTEAPKSSSQIPSLGLEHEGLVREMKSTRAKSMRNCA